MKQRGELVPSSRRKRLPVTRDRIRGADAGDIAYRRKRIASFAAVVKTRAKAPRGQMETVKISGDERDFCSPRIAAPVSGFAIFIEPCRRRRESFLSVVTAAVYAHSHL